MLTRIYNGPSPEVEIPLAEPLDDGTSIIVAPNGVPTEFPDAIAEALDEQGETWLHPDGESRDAKEIVPELRKQAKEAGIKVPRGASRDELEVLLAGQPSEEHSDAESSDNQASGDPGESTTADAGEKE